MSDLIASLISKIGIPLVIALGAFFGGMALMHKFDAGELANYKLAAEKQHAADLAAAAEKQKQIDGAAIAAASAEAATQGANAAMLQKELANVTAHVSAKAVPCISWGLVRVLDAAALGVSPDDLSLPAGKSDDTCSPFTAAQLAVSVVSSFGAARANADQLNALIGLLKKQGVTVK
jgi:hypothetical protein